VVTTEPNYMRGGLSHRARNTLEPEYRINNFSGRSRPPFLFGPAGLNSIKPPIRYCHHSWIPVSYLHSTNTLDKAWTTLHTRARYRLVTVMSTAVTERGYEGAVKLLLERNDINPNTANTEYCRTPLWWAAERGHEGIVKLLLEREDINLNTKHGRTPLWSAVMGGYEGIVKMLLERDDINPNTADTEHGRTPLEWAAEAGYEGIVKLLLEREDPNPDRLGLGGETALELATPQGHAGVVQLLSEPKPSLPNTADTGDMWRKSANWEHLEQ